MNAVAQELFKPAMHHARLLADGKGSYGLCVESGMEDDLPWLTPKSIVVRPDYIGSDSHLPTLFQFVPKNRQPWAIGNESTLIERLHKLMLADRGIEPLNKPDAEYWRRWHGLRRAATRVINSLLAELYATIPTERLRIVRRYPISLRSKLYQGLCGASDRAWQLADTFPWLALVVYDPRVSGPVDKARSLVDRGAKLRDVARAVDCVRVPMALCRFKPAVVRQALGLRNFLLDHPNLVAHHCPETVPRQRAWLSVIAQATDPDMPACITDSGMHISTDDFGIPF